MKGPGDAGFVEGRQLLVVPRRSEVLSGRLMDGKSVGPWSDESASRSVRESVAHKHEPTSDRLVPSSYVHPWRPRQDSNLRPTDWKSGAFRGHYLHNI